MQSICLVCRSCDLAPMLLLYKISVGSMIPSMYRRNARSYARIPDGRDDRSDSVYARLADHEKCCLELEDFISFNT
jgi:hypothetical protein